HVPVERGELISELHDVRVLLAEAGARRGELLFEPRAPRAQRLGSGSGPRGDEHMAERGHVPDLARDAVAPLGSSYLVVSVQAQWLWAARWGGWVRFALL